MKDNSSSFCTVPVSFYKSASSLGCRHLAAEGRVGMSGEILLGAEFENSPMNGQVNHNEDLESKVPCISLVGS